MADWKGSSGFGGSSRRDEDFEEEDVWSLIKERKPKEYSSASSSSSSSAWRLPSAPRMIPRVYTPTTHEACRVVQQSSAPVDIPDWSKIYGKNAKIDSRHGSWVDDDGDDGTAVSNGVAYHNDDDDDVDNDDGDMVPPHEWIARKLARSQISSFSVCEGIGRTLKGRDLSKVRNAILTKTGFLE